jgi:hypothetical protein
MCAEIALGKHVCSVMEPLCLYAGPHRSHVWVLLIRQYDASHASNTVLRWRRCTKAGLRRTSDMEMMRGEVGTDETRVKSLIAKYWRALLYHRGVAECGKSVSYPGAMSACRKAKLQVTQTCCAHHARNCDHNSCILWLTCNVAPLTHIHEKSAWHKPRKQRIQNKTKAIEGGGAEVLPLCYTHVLSDCFDVHMLRISVGAEWAPA